VSRLSAAIITLDEERNIGRCLESLAGVADEIVVVDSGSRDGTERLCRAAGAAFVRQPWLGYGPQKNRAAELCSGELILSLDADEALSPELRAAILAVKAAPDADAWEVNRANWMYDRFLRHGELYPDRKLRLWRRGRARWTDETIHETARPEPGARVARLSGDLLHYTVTSREQHLGTIERFTTLQAEAMLRAGRRSGVVKRWISPPVHFLRTFLLKRGFLDGAAGFRVSRLSAWATWLKYSKLERLRRERRDR
jgi:glycosyltransferase involved in cell wall biosynthesis